ncbi:hypothetical protein [Caenimonas sp. SL110]|uniref:hypothetical protein n=1 Tax=Caenimonas sp. SL110 TaxID=1450524 RepID=UPI00128B0FAC|nr:hypothetical protein [Caenimonas sp. SL110]
MDVIAFQFGLGLLATGYAVFARMHLTSISTWIDEQSPEVVLDRYLKRTQELVTNVEIASTQFSSFASSLMARTEAATTSATATAEKSMLELARVFDQQLRQTLASGNQGLTDLRSLVNETSFAEEREALARSVKVTLECVLHLNKALLEFSTRSTETAAATTHLHDVSIKLTDSMATLSDSLEQVGGPNGTIIRSVDSFEGAHSNAVRTTQALSEVVEELSALGGSLGGVGTTFKQLKTLTAKAQQQLETLAQASGQLELATESFVKSSHRTQEFADGIERVTGVLPGMGDRVLGLDGQLEQLRVTTSAVEHHLQALPRPVDDAIMVTNELRSALSAMQAMLQSAGGDAQNLSTNTQEALDYLKQAHKLTADVSGLQSTTKAVNDLLAEIAANGVKATATLTQTSDALHKTVSIAASSLDKDVQTASRAASLFTEKLTVVAQNIIDETRKARVV